MVVEVGGGVGMKHTENDLVSHSHCLARFGESLMALILSDYRDLSRVNCNNVGLQV